MSLDKVLECKNCGKDFIFSASEQEFFAERGYHNDPAKCKDCRKLAKKQKESRQSLVTCTHCGRTEKVTFQVAHPQYLLCNNCFEKLQPHIPVPNVPIQPETPRSLEVVNLEVPSGTSLP